MSIRVRLVVVSLLVAVPIASAFAGYLVAVSIRENMNGLVQWVDAHLADPAFQARCRERGFSSAPEPGNHLVVEPEDGTSETAATAADEPYRLIVFDETLQRPFPAAAVVPPEVFRGLAAGSAEWLTRVIHPPLRRLYVLPVSRWYVKATGWGGNCAFAAATMAVHETPSREVIALMTMVGAIFVAALVSGGTVVRRVRRLTRAVRGAADRGYEEPIPVEGHDELATLARTFNEAGDGVRRHLREVADREATLRDFVANAGHDIASPLSVLQGHLSALDASSGLPEESRLDVRGAIGEAVYLGSILRNLAATAKLEAPGWIVDMSPTHLGALVERVVARHQPAARAANVELNVAVPTPPLMWNTDATLFEQALSNVVDNAIRYNRPGGHVAVVLDPVPGGFVLAVTDDGPGVAHEDFARLGERRFRTDGARSRRPEGQGLGLAIVREAADRLELVLNFSRSQSGGLAVELRASPHFAAASPSSLRSGRPAARS